MNVSVPIKPGITRRKDNGHVVEDLARHTDKKGKEWVDGIWFLNEEGKRYLYPLHSLFGYSILSDLENPEPATTPEAS